jgi:hypothetical protein
MVLPCENGSKISGSIKDGDVFNNDYYLLNKVSILLS